MQSGWRVASKYQSVVHGWPSNSTSRFMDKGHEVVAQDHTEKPGFEPMPVPLVCSVPDYPHMQHICPLIYCTTVMVTILGV